MKPKRLGKDDDGDVALESHGKAYEKLLFGASFYFSFPLFIISQRRGVVQ